MPGTTGACAGLLIGKAVPSVADLEAYTSFLVGGEESNRNVIETCRSWPCEYARTEVNLDMRRFDFADLKDDHSIIVGAARWRPNNEYSDIFYKVGTGMPDNQDTRRTFVVVYPKGAHPPKDPTYGTIAASWKLFGLTGKPVAVVQLRSGYVVRCTNPHPDTNVVSSGFRGCPSLTRLHGISAETGIPLPDLLAVSECEMDLIKSIGGDARAACAKQRDANLAALKRRYASRGNVVSGLKATDFGDPDSDAYWFACGNGCCTADDPI